MSVILDIQSLVRVGMGVRARRRSRQAWSRYRATNSASDAKLAEVVVYFADDAVNIYQIQQWYEPLRQTAEQHPVAVVVRNVNTAVALAQECPLPIVLLEQIADIEAWLASQEVAIVMYVNQNSRNFQMLRFRRPIHVFASHGESDKDYMASNQLKAYDFTLVAGDAAIERISHRLTNYDAQSRLIKIGRPQVDVAHSAPSMPTDGRTVVLYAPTWEGDRPTMTYSSLKSHGHRLIQALIANDMYRIVYRPHPRTGIADPTYKKADREITKLIEHANRVDASAHHLVDKKTKFGWHLSLADACVTDISAVAFDWLTTGKPLILTEPASADASIDEQGIAGRLPLLNETRASDIEQMLANTDSPRQSATRAKAAQYYFGDTRPGVASGLFQSAINDLLVAQRRDRIGH